MTQPAQNTRVRGLDVARGLVMVLMAIDHVRVYAGVPAGGPDPAVFFTRWVTHFCAPGFVFFAGTSAYLRCFKYPGTAALSRHLLTRGLLLVLIELTVMRFFWTFNFDVINYNLAGVLWMIGWSMAALAGLVWLPFEAIAALGLTIVLGHNLVDPYLRDVGRAIGESPFRWFWQFLYFGGSVSLGQSGPRIAILYTLMPWIGVMAAGYAFGRVLQWPSERRNRACLAIGGAATAAFMLLRTFNLYGDPRPWNGEQPLTFLNTTKYPASLLFLLMTLGPALLFLRAVDGRSPGLLRPALVFGRVPLFYYVLHVVVMHLMAVAVCQWRYGDVYWMFESPGLAQFPVTQPPDWPLALPYVYLCWVMVIVILYPLCRWFAGVRRRRTDWWLSYL